MINKFQPAMKKAIKISAIVFVSLFIILLILPFAFKGKIQSKVIEEANKSLNAKVNFSDISLSLIKNFPNINLSINNFTIVGIDTFKLDTLANIPTISVTVDLMSVIKGDNYKIKKIYLDNPKFFLKALADTAIKPNWDIVKPDTIKSTDTSKSNFKMTLQKFEIDGGTIVYDDATFPVYTKLEKVNYLMKGDFTADFTSLSIKTSIEKVNLIYNHIKYLNNANSDLNIVVDADLKNSKYTIKESDIKLNELNLGVSGIFTMLKDGYGMDLKMFAKKNEFKNFLSMVPSVYSNDFEKVKTSGNLALDAYVKGIYNAKQMPGFGVKIIVENAMFQYPSLPKAVKDIQLNVQIDCPSGNFDATEINVNRFHCEMAGNPVDMKLSVKTPVSDAQIKGNIKGKIDLTTVKDFYPLQKDVHLEGTVAADISMDGRMSSIEKKKYEDFKALGKLDIAGINYKSKDYPQGIFVKNLALDFTPKQVNLTDMNIRFGKSDLSAKGRIDNLLAYVFKNEMLTGNLETSSTLIDMNEWMTPSTQNTKADTTKLSVIDVPANIDFTLHSKINKLLYDKMDMSQVDGKITVRKKRVSLENLKMMMLSGQMILTGYYETVIPKQPKVAFDINIDQFDIPSAYNTFTTIQKLAPIASKTKGKFSTKMNFISTLDEHMMPVYKTITGKGTLTTSKITVENVAAQQKIADALKMDKLRKMMIDNVKLNFTISEGKLFVEPFDFNVDNIKTTVTGSTSIDQKIDYDMNFAIPRKDFGGQANNVLNNLVSQANSKGTNLSVGDVVNTKVKLTGTVTNPLVKIDLASSSKNIKEEMKQQVKKELETKAQSEADRLKKEAEAKAKAEADKAKNDAGKKIQNEMKNQLKKLF